MGCCFESKTAKLSSAEPDPTKHVNYTVGMVLGEDDFRQEFAYLSGRDQWLARDLVGYGTVRGLALRTEWDGAEGPRIYVDAGAALTPRGQLVCVPTPQCANVNAWLDKHKAEVEKALASPPAGVLPLYVMLCYRECPTDEVPIPGEPCRSEDQLVKPSRLKDDFVLQISLTPPEQREEKALRDYCDWLGRVDMGDPATTSPSLEQFLDAIRHAAAPWFSPPASPPPGDFLSGSPPASLRVHPADAGRFLRAAFDLWVTELRPKWHARWHGCAPGASQASPLEDCVLLGEVRVSLVPDPSSGGWMATGGELPKVFQDQRPYVLHLRMLQEWLLCGRGGETTELAPGSAVVPETSFGLLPGPGSGSAYARADHTHGTPALPALAGDASGAITASTVNRVRGIDVITTGAATGQILQFNGAAWAPAAAPAAPTPGTSVTGETSFGLTASLGTSASYARADHTHGTPALPALAGDASGAITASTVNRVRGVDVITTGASTGQILRFNGTAWAPAAAPAAPTPGTSVTAETSFGITAALGSSASYARADHTHGTPALPGLAGDATGAITASTVNRVRGVDVITTGATTGMFLAFNGSAWAPTPAPDATGQFVTRGSAQPYAIVAAGAFEFRFTHNDGANTKVTGQVSGYNGLASLDRGTNDPIDTFYFNFKGLPTAGAEKRYIVKLTPWWDRETKAGFILYFAGFSQDGGKGRLAVKVVGDPGTTAIIGNLMIEVSEIQG